MATSCSWNFRVCFFRISISEISFDSRPALGVHQSELAPTTEIVRPEPEEPIQPTTVTYVETRPRENINSDAEGEINKNIEI